MTGNSVIAFSYGGGVIIACDTLGALVLLHGFAQAAALWFVERAMMIENLILSMNGAAAAARGRRGAAC